MKFTATRCGVLVLIVAFALTPMVASAATVRPYVVNGDPSTINARPYQVGILDIRRGPTPYTQLRCGGSVVTSTIIVTAGHCTFDQLSYPSIGTSASNLRVLVNTANLLSGGQTVAVSSIERHPNYNPAVDEGLDDIAILRLASPVTAKPVSIIPSQSDYRVNLPNAVGTVSGWGCSIAGATCRLQEHYPTTLQRAQIPLHDNSFCSNFYDIFSIKFNGTKHLCAGSPSAYLNAPGACYGDSGGPLTTDGVGGKDLLIGVVSWGVLCGGAPAAFTRISTYRAWLVSKGVPVQPPPFTSSSGPSIAAAAIPVVGDFDGDGHHDLLTYLPNSTPDLILRGTGARNLVPGSSTTINGTYEPIVCDTNHDNKDDLLLYGALNKPDSALFGEAEPGAFGSAPVLSINGTYRPVAADFTGDGICDVLLYAPGPAVDKLMVGTGTGLFTQRATSNVKGIYQPVVGDFNGDGHVDLYWYAPNGTSHQWNGATGAHFTDVPTAQPVSNLVPVAGDFDGNGRTDILWYGSGSMLDQLWSSTASGFRRNHDVTVNGTYRPVALDIDGDGTDEVLWVARNGTTSIWTSTL